MSKIFIKKIIIFLFFLPLILFAQEVEIQPLSKEINTKDAEINFIQINDSTAYFTSIAEKQNKITSNIYTASFVNKNWVKKNKSIYNSTGFNTSNITVSENKKVFFTICDENMSRCKIVFSENYHNKVFNELLELKPEENFNTQPHIVKQGDQQILYFVSDRKGGFGGLDIWLSIIDKQGNLGVPINLGKNINSNYDEITPFYNSDDGSLYYSSNKKGGLGGFDIYKSEGSLNLWKNTRNVKELNSKKDEMYISFYKKRQGFITSNRKGAVFESVENCCNDIFKFTYLNTDIDTTEYISVRNKYLPLSLYFHNDEPDCCTMNTKTQKTYKQSYISYFIMQPEYERKNSSLNNFFENKLKKNFNDLNKLLELILVDLEKGKKIKLQIRGYSSPLHEVQYNKNLSKRRISSFVNYLRQYKNNIFEKYILSKKIEIEELPLGESTSSERVSDDAHNKQKSIYSLEAMMERKIEIVDVISEQ